MIGCYLRKETPMPSTPLTYKSYLHQFVCSLTLGSVKARPAFWLPLLNGVTIPNKVMRDLFYKSTNLHFDLSLVPTEAQSSPISRFILHVHMYGTHTLKPEAASFGSRNLQIPYLKNDNGNTASALSRQTNYPLAGLPNTNAT